MEELKSSIDQALSYLHYAQLSDIIDMLIVAFLFYQVISLIRKTNSNRIARGVIVILLALWISDWQQLTVVNFILRGAVEIGILALVILFQPELRRALEKVGSRSVLSFLRGSTATSALEASITQIVLACGTMSSERTGALIVFERLTSLDGQINTGAIINAEVTAELVKNIFFDKAPLHDGAIIIRDGRLVAAGCMLPLSANPNLSRELGMRHRAALGMSEHSDAVVATVSEETGAISIAVDGMLKRHLTTETFEKILRNELLGDGLKKPTLRDKLRSVFLGEGGARDE
jgi:diadenylate cyclase